MSLRTALFWHKHIQPDIESSLEPRADRNWPWVYMRMFLPLVMQLKKRRCRALSVYVRGTGGAAIPAAMLLLIERYPYIDGVRSSTFTWFISSAPKPSLVRLGVANPPSLGRVLVDTALVHSLALGCAGRMWLHCAPAGGQRLMEFYGRECGLINFDPAIALPTRHANDGRFFGADEQLAMRLLTALDGLR